MPILLCYLCDASTSSFSALLNHSLHLSFTSAGNFLLLFCLVPYFQNIFVNLVWSIIITYPKSSSFILRISATKSRVLCSSFSSQQVLTLQTPRTVTELYTFLKMFFLMNQKWFWNTQCLRLKNVSSKILWYTFIITSIWNCCFRSMGFRITLFLEPHYGVNHRLWRKKGRKKERRRGKTNPRLLYFFFRRNGKCRFEYCL
jgi:hypothetical protein